MITLAEFNASFEKDILRAGETFEDMQRLAQIISRVGGIPRVLAKSNTPVILASVNGAGDTANNIIQSFTLPDRFFRGNNSLWLHSLVGHTNSASTKTFGWRLADGTSVITTTATTTGSTQMSTVLHTTDVDDTQRLLASATAGWDGASASLATRSIANSNPVVLNFTGSWGAGIASESITLHSFMAMFVPG